ncbi:MAG: sigma-70 family RNA polymerase sigma factor [Sedimentisphaerales bacterium]|nr:sigma-70 family RNA polymerase sigma factor [Sedimentisphaerales bacterium]
MLAKPRNEIELLEASLRGSTRAFESVVSEYQSLVCAITYSATRNVEKSEELAQEVFLRAWKGLAQLKDLTKFRAWLCSIARSTVQNWRRSERHDVVHRAVALDAAAEHPSYESGPEEVAISREQQAVVDHALAQIPESIREPLILFYREHKSTREVADLLGLSESAVRQRISRGRSLLRDQVAAMIEKTISRNGPGKAFTAAVAVSLAALATKSATTAAAHAGTSGGGLGLTTAASSAAAKIVALAAGLVIVAGGVAAYRYLRAPSRSPDSVPASRRTVEQPSPHNGRAQELPRVAAGTGRAGPQATLAPGTPPAVEPSDSAPMVPQAQAEPFKFRPKGVLSGVITDIETGQPVRDVLVRITNERLFDARTDANGFYCFETVPTDGNYSIAVDSLDHLGIPWGRANPTIYLRSDAQAVKHFGLPRACMAELQVVDANGIGVEGAKVVATSLADERQQAVGYFADARRTDPNGLLLLGGFPPVETDYLITVWHQRESRVREEDAMRIVDYEYDLAPASATVRLTDPNLVPRMRIVLEPGRPVHGYAAYADGVPATDVTIVARPSWWHCNYRVYGCETNADGTFVLDHVTPGTYDICMEIIRPDFAGGITRTITQTTVTAENVQPLLLRLPEKSPQSLAAISGRFIFAGEGRPKGIDIQTYSPRFGNTRVAAGYEPGGDVKDTFVIDRLEPGTYSLTFSGSDIEQKIVENVEAPTSGLEIELLYTAKPTLTGTVGDALTGEPVKRFRIRAKKLSTLRGTSYVQPDRWAYFDDERGSFSLDTVGPGIYQVQVVAEGYAPAWSEPINTDDAVTVSVALTAGGAVRGMVIDEAGRLIAGAKVIPLSLVAGTTAGTQSPFASENGAVEAENGTFVLTNLPAGQETIKVTHPDHAFALMPEITVTEGQITEGITVVLREGGTVEGYVYDNEGATQAREVLYFQDAPAYSGAGDEEAGRLATAVTDSNGSYRVEHLPERPCYVNRSAQWKGLGVARRTVLPRNGAVLRLDFGGGPVITGVAIVDGAALAHRRLLLAAADTPDLGVFKCLTSTDEHGGFVFRGAVPGTFGVYRERRERQNDWTKIATITVGPSDTEVGIVGNALAQLRVTLNDPAEDSPWQIARLVLFEGGKPLGQPLVVAEPPTEEGFPWVFPDAGPGVYALTVVRPDQVQLRREIVLEAGRDCWDLAIDLPPATARVAGHVAGSAADGLVLWRDDKSVMAAIVPGPGGTFAIEALPAGQYRVGPALSYLYDTPALVEFDLADGQARALELNPTGQTQIAHLLVQVVDHNGVMREDAEVRLDGPLGAIEPLGSAHGSYAFLAAPGPQTLRVSVMGYAAVERPVTLQATGLATEPAPQTVLVRLEAPQAR